MAGKSEGVTVGDQLRKTDSTNWVWQVTEFVTPRGHQPHARLVRVNYPSESRMFAIAALRDRRLFVDADQPREVVPPIQWGRRPDGTNP